jgi:AcrR family transcriptional regulator
VVINENPSRRRRIEDVASVLFRERGYAATSVRDIARALDVQGASLYAHVTSKEDVLWAIVDRAAARFEAAAAQADAAASRGGATERIAALVRAHVTVITSDPGEASVFVHEWRSLSPDRRDQVAVRRDAYERRFRQVIADGMAAGEFALTDPAVAAAFLLSAMNGLATWYRPDGRLPSDRIADHFVDLSIRALVGGT